MSAGNALINAGSTIGSSVLTDSLVKGGAAAATGAAGIGASLASAGVTAGLSLAVAGLTMWLQSAKLRGKQKVAATTIANQVEGKLKELKDAYESSSKTEADWLAAKNVQTQLLDYFQGPSGCGNAELAAAGQRCLSERLCKEGCLHPWLEWYSLGEKPAASVRSSSGSLSNEVESIIDSALGGGSLNMNGLLLMAAVGFVLYGATR
jgi:hypothetical protein